MEVVLLLSGFLFVTGFLVVLFKKNLILMLMGIELMLNAVNINFVYFSKSDPNPVQGQIFAIVVMLIAAAEIAVGLAIVIKIKEFYKEINPDNIESSKN